MKKFTVLLFELYFRKSAIAPQLTQHLAYFRILIERKDCSWLGMQSLKYEGIISTLM